MRSLLLTAAAASLIACAVRPCAAQELNATVTVNAPQLTIIPPATMEDFETAVREFLNATNFTDEEYAPEERINCNFTFTVQGETNESQFVADVLVQSTRPVFGSDYETTVINYLDAQTVVEYEQYQPLEYSVNGFTSSLVSLLTFHANVIIGMDRDSFAPLAGEPFYRVAENVTTLLPPAIQNLDKGWTNGGNQRSRFRLIQEILNPRARPYRQLMYDYHLGGLDLMAEDPVAGRTVMARALEKLRDVQGDIPNSLLIVNFTSAKSQELVDVFSPAPQPEKQAIYALMTAVAPASGNKFAALR